MNRTLILIFAVLALMIGSFIWFVATWDRDAEQSLSQAMTPISLTQKLPSEGRS